MLVFSNVLVLRDEGFLPSEIKVNVGRDGSLQHGSSKIGNILMHSPAVISNNEVQKEILRCLSKSLESYESNAIDPLVVLKAKAKNNYILNRAIVRHTLKNRNDN